MARSACVNHVQRDADRNRFAVPDSELGELLQLVCRPVPEIERTRRAKLEWVAGGGDVVDVQFGAAMDQLSHRFRREVRQGLGIGFDPLEELTVANQRHLHRLDVAVTLVPIAERGEQVKIIDHRIRRGKGSDKILFAKGVDSVFHADAGIGLAECGGRYPHVAHAAMRCG